MHNLSDWVTHMNWVDFVFMVVIVYSALTGAWLGFLSECLSVAGILAGTIVAGQVYHSVGTLGGHVGVQTSARDWVGFAATFVVISLIFRIIAVLARRLSRVMSSGWSNVVAGGLLGILAGATLCLFAIVTIAYFHVGTLQDALSHSKIAASSSTWLREFTTLLPDKMRHIPGYIS